MKIKLHSIILSLLLITTPFVQAVEPLPKNLIDFTSPQGQRILKESLDKSRGQKKVNNTLKLMANFTTQNTVTYCGVASLVTVLNSSNLQKPDDLLHKPFHYFTQENFFNPIVEGIVPAEVVKDNGITLDELARMANEGFKLPAKAYHANYFYSADPPEALRHFRRTLRDALANNQFVIANFSRDGISPNMGGGHHSPVVAYDEKSDRFLLLDVARYKYPSYWVKTKDLWNGVNTMDSTSGITRGILVMTNPVKANVVEKFDEEIVE